jgi:hypothetical protein
MACPSFMKTSRRWRRNSKLEDPARSARPTHTVARRSVPR